MSIKYNKTMVNDYIIGNDILEYELEELENDAKFMSDVMIQSKDIKMYDFASDDVKSDYYFVRTVIETFKENEDFIIEVADNYLEYAKNHKKELLTEQDEKVINIFDYAKGNNEMTGVCYAEINILMDSFIKGETKRMPYALVATMDYECTMVEIASYQTARKNDPSLTNIGLGFLYVMEKYNNNPIILDYYAKRMLDDIFYSENELFSDRFHRLVKTKEEVTKESIKNFVVNYVNQYDEFLSGHIAARIADDSKFISELEKDIQRTLKNWDSYVNYHNNVKLDVVWQEAYDEFKKYDTVYSFSQFVDTVMKKLGLEEINKKYYDGSALIAQGDLLPEELTNLGDIAFMNYLEKFISNLFGLTQGGNDTEEQSKGEAKIITFPKK